MTQTTSSPKSYNIMALRGAKIDDMEYVDMFQLPKEIAYTPAINTAMLDMSYQENIEAGIPEEKAKANKMAAEKNIKHLLAKKGMLK